MTKDKIWLLTLLQVGWIIPCPFAPASHKAPGIILLLAPEKEFGCRCAHRFDAQTRQKTLCAHHSPSSKDQHYTRTEPNF